MAEQKRFTVSVESVEKDFEVDYRYGILPSHEDRFLCVRVYPDIRLLADDHSVFSMERHMVMSKAIDKLGQYEDICPDVQRLREIVAVWEIMNQQTCHECVKNQSREHVCSRLPKWGRPVRYNCPYFQSKE